MSEKTAHNGSHGETDESGFADIHCHILPGLDDGAENAEVSFAMAQLAIEAGTRDLAATPHANYTFHYDPERNASLRGELQARIDSELGGGLRLHIGCDFHLTYENIQDAIANYGKYSLDGGRYLLVEFPEVFAPDGMEQALLQLLDANYVPVLTHPERNPTFQIHADLLARYVRLGCVAQITGSSYLGGFGRQAQRAAEEYLKRELVHVIASDGHGIRGRRPILSEAAGRIVSLSGEAVAQALSRDNPLAILHNQASLPYYPSPEAHKKKKFFAWR